MSTVRIGSYTLTNNLILAPMAGVTDRPQRLLCARFGAGLTVSEMLTSDTRLWSTRKSSLRLLSDSDPEPRAVQIAGAEPAMLANAAQHAVALGAQIIDINMGCPAKKSARKQRAPRYSKMSSWWRKSSRQCVQQWMCLLL